MKWSMNGNRRDCREARERIENQPARRGAEGGGGWSDRHLDHCPACSEYAQLRHWSAQVVRAGDFEVAPPLMSAVWASIHRASEQAWDSALTRSFRYLLPYMVAVVALIALVGGITAGGLAGGTPAVQAASSAFSVLNQPEPSNVANVMSTSNLPPQDPAALLGVARRR